MPKTKTKKQIIIQELINALKKQNSMVFVGYKGIKVKEFSSLREQLKDIGAKLQVIKKTLFQKALQEIGINLNIREIGNEIAAVFAFKDALSPLKLLFQFAKTNENLKILGGYFEKQIQSVDILKELALIPSKEELFGRITLVLSAPLSGFVNVLEGNVKGLLYILTSVSKSKS